MDAIGEAQRRMETVWTAARLADRCYDERLSDAHGLTRAEYVGKAVVAALYADIGNGRPPNARAVDEGR
jgi:hypothetical protein